MHGKGKVTNVWKRKSYGGKVKPVKNRIRKTPKPGTGALRKVYSKMSKAGEWAVLDNLCLAIQTYEPVVAYLGLNVQKMTVPQAKAFRDGLHSRLASYTATTDEDKKACLIKAITALEKSSTGILKLPSLKPYLDRASKKHKKLNGLKDKIQPKYDRLLKALHELFPESGLTFEVVPFVLDPVSNGQIARKFDHSRFTVYYSRAHAKDLLKKLRSEGLMPVFIEESIFISRAMSFTDHDGTYKPNHKVQVRVLHEMMVRFLQLAGKTKAGKLIRRKKEKSKGKKESVKKVEG